VGGHILRGDFSFGIALHRVSRDLIRASSRSERRIDQSQSVAIGSCYLDPRSVARIISRSRKIYALFEDQSDRVGRRWLFPSRSRDPSSASARGMAAFVRETPRSGTSLISVCIKLTFLIIIDALARSELSRVTREFSSRESAKSNPVSPRSR